MIINQNKYIMSKQTVYKVNHNGSYCIVFLLSDALDIIKVEVEDNYSEEESPLEYTLSVEEMTEKEINSLPEFDGF